MDYTPSVNRGSNIISLEVAKFLFTLICNPVHIGKNMIEKLLIILCSFTITFLTHPFYFDIDKNSYHMVFNIIPTIDSQHHLIPEIPLT